LARPVFRAVYRRLNCETVADDRPQATRRGVLGDRGGGRGDPLSARLWSVVVRAWKVGRELSCGANVSLSICASRIRRPQLPGAADGTVCPLLPLVLRPRSIQGLSKCGHLPLTSPSQPCCRDQRGSRPGRGAVTSEHPATSRVRRSIEACSQAPQRWPHPSPRPYSATTPRKLRKSRRRTVLAKRALPEGRVAGPPRSMVTAEEYSARQNYY